MFAIAIAAGSSWSWSSATTRVLSPRPTHPRPTMITPEVGRKLAEKGFAIPGLEDVGREAKVEAGARLCTKVGRARDAILTPVLTFYSSAHAVNPCRGSSRRASWTSEPPPARSSKPSSGQSCSSYFSRRWRAVQWTRRLWPSRPREVASDATSGFATLQSDCGRCRTRRSAGSSSTTTACRRAMPSSSLASRSGRKRGWRIPFHRAS
eukprot:2328176-Prymnesium_polylepis.1